MAIKYPKNQKELVDSAKTDFQQHNQTSNPFLKNSFLGALLTSFALRVWDFYIQLKEFEKEFFLPTADRFLPIFGAWWGVTQNQATKSSGNIVMVGGVTSVIPSNSKLTNTSGEEFSTTAEAIISLNVLTVTIVRSAQTATATTSTPHGLASLATVTIAGAVQQEYNGIYIINVIAENQFTYEITGSPASPATGAITGTSAFANVVVNSVGFGVVTNVNSGEPLSFSSPISGVNNIARADFNAINGGADAETKEDYRARILEKVQKPVANFNVSAIVQKAKEVPGVTRVFVKPATPAAGQCRVYFVRDNDDIIIPDAGEISTTKNKILEIKPVTVADSAVIVLAPTAVVSSFVFTAISPDTSSMRDAITTSLSVAVKKQTEGVDFKEDEYKAAITSTVDRVANVKLNSYTLTTTGDFSVASGSIATLGTIAF